MAWFPNSVTIIDRSPASQTDTDMISVEENEKLSDLGDEDVDSSSDEEEIDGEEEESDVEERDD